MESLLVWVLTGAAVVALLRRSRAASTIGLATALVASTAAGHALWSARRARQERSDDTLRATLPRPVSDGGYVSSDSCRACHPSQYASWHKSYHRTMTQAATAGAVQAPFAGETLTADDGQSYRLRRNGDELWVDVSGGGARRITMMTGSHHMQAFWIPGDRGNEQIEFPFTYLLDERRWVSRREVFLVGSEYAKDPAVWNGICVECHVTAGQPGWDPPGLVPSSKVAELGIACEACHGPAREHVAANASPFRRQSLHQAERGDPTIVNPARLPPVRVSEVCGQCHGIGCPRDGWRQSGIGYRPGQPLDVIKPVLRLASMRDTTCRAQIDADPSFVPTRYWRDGMVRVSGREYNGLIESPCYRGGAFTCLSCHSMHESDPDKQVTRGREGNAACTQCHLDYAEHLEKHTHHKESSSGSSCTNCHMPHTTYGLLRAMRSHQISVPSVQATLATERPNACNLCHLDRTLAWTAATLARWYGTPVPTLSAEQRSVAASLLDATRGEAGVRALTAWSFGWPAARGAAPIDWAVPLLIELLDDDYAAVRRIAYESLKTVSGFDDFAYDYVAPPSQRRSAQDEARRRWPREGQLSRGELERLFAERREDDQMFLAE
jgi:predicted CXXCH cytochrome family protein